jgi:hypothetical protein
VLVFLPVFANVDLCVFLFFLVVLIFLVNVYGVLAVSTVVWNGVGFSLLRFFFLMLIVDNFVLCPQAGLWLLAQRCGR